MLKIELENRAEKFLKRLPKKQAGQIGRKILMLAQDPYPPDSKKLSGSRWRGTDIGECRIIYTANERRLLIPLIGKRNDDDVYRRLRRME